jgi:hypothetical protein
MRAHNSFKVRPSLDGHENEYGECSDPTIVGGRINKHFWGESLLQQGHGKQKERCRGRLEWPCGI